jgi:hypothetical protein
MLGLKAKTNQDPWQEYQDLCAKCIVARLAGSVNGWGLLGLFDRRDSGEWP